MSAEAQLIDTFYQAFGRRDAEGMIACYAPDIVFSDPVFGQLQGDRAGQMWRMLCARGKDLRISYRDVTADATRGTAQWEAHYTFSSTGRPVHNLVSSTFQFRDGKIIRHDDVFDLYRWARQALGVKGVLLGWAPPVQGAIRATAQKGLEAFAAQAR